MINRIVTFNPPGWREPITATIIAVDVRDIDGMPVGDYDEPVYVVETDWGEMWAIHPSWITSK
jgi:hypothetical protein